MINPTGSRGNVFALKLLINPISRRLIHRHAHETSMPRPALSRQSMTRLNPTAHPAIVPHSLAPGFWSEDSGRVLIARFGKTIWFPSDKSCCRMPSFPR